MSRRRSVFRFSICSCLLVAFSVLSVVGSSFSFAQDNDDDNDIVDPFVEALMEQMTAAEKIGQLFVVTFEGNNLSAQADIANLIANYKVGGVMPLSTNQNFRNDETLAEQVISLNRGLQQRTWASVF